MAADGDDGTRELALETARHGEPVRVIGNPKRSGKGRGVREAMALARGDIAGYADADNKVPIEEFDKFRPLLAAERRRGHRLAQHCADSQIEKRQPLYRRLGGKGFGLFMHAVGGPAKESPEVPSQCGFSSSLRGRRRGRSSSTRQQIDGYMFDVEILVLARRLGVPDREQVPIRWHDDAWCQPAGAGEREPAHCGRHISHRAVQPAKKAMNILVTGAAGFIGSNLVDRLLADGHEVTGFDNLSTGQVEFLDAALRSPHFRLEHGDLLDPGALERAMEAAEFVFHMAANADVRFGTQHPRKDLEQNTIGTANVLEAMRARGVRRIAFPSTGSVYGEPSIFPTPEDAPFPVQTSLYAASKLAAEAMIEAYCEGFGMEGHIFRFVSILGERYTHGHILDFYKQLREHSGHLDVLGDGRQRKSYLYVQDCVDAMLLAIDRAAGKAESI